MNPIDILTQSIENGNCIVEARHFDIVSYRAEDGGEVSGGCITSIGGVIIKADDGLVGTHDDCTIMLRAGTPQHPRVVNVFVPYDQITEVIVRPRAGVFVTYAFRETFNGHTYVHEHVGQIVDNDIINANFANFETSPFIPAITIQSLSSNEKFLIPLCDIIEEISDEEMEISDT